MQAIRAVDSDEIGDAMTPEITACSLPPEAARPILDLAAQGDVLLLGELHGTQEVPRLVLGLLPELASLGYRALALEIPCHERDALQDWAGGDAPEPPSFFTRPCTDGRGNAQALSLVRQAALQGWRMLCFDLGQGQPFTQWRERDARMARNLTDQWRQLCPESKVLGICGNFHSRLVNTAKPGDWAYEYWPAFAAALQALRPGQAVRSVNITPHSGAFFNGTVRDLQGEPLAQAEIRTPEGCHHSLELHLPQATPVTFLTEPKD